MPVQFKCFIICQLFQPQQNIIAYNMGGMRIKKLPKHMPKENYWLKRGTRKASQTNKLWLAAVWKTDFSFITQVEVLFG